MRFIQKHFLHPYLIQPRKMADWTDWTEMQGVAFNTIMDIVTSSLILQHSDFTKQLTACTVADSSGIGVILRQG
jgi:hypothetical protein